MKRYTTQECERGPHDAGPERRSQTPSAWTWSRPTSARRRPSKEVVDVLEQRYGVGAGPQRDIVAAPRLTAPATAFAGAAASAAPTESADRGLADAAGTYSVDCAPARAAPGGIAVVGLAATLPDAPDAATFWENLCAGRNSIVPFPRERAPEGATNVPGWGAFVREPDYFDPLFFRLSPKEAKCIDP